MDCSILAESSAAISRTKLFVPYNRSSVCGKGINDFPAPTKYLKSYATWVNVLKRCYSEPRSVRNLSYAGCSVVEEWLYFSKFESWHTEHYREGYHLDKDLLFHGNKVYGPDFCTFVTPELNSLLTDCARARGNQPLGVSVDGAKFKARVCRDSCSLFLGLFNTPLEAHQAWQAAKADIIANFPTDDPRIRAALDLRVDQLRDDLKHNRITVTL